MDPAAKAELIAEYAWRLFSAQEGISVSQALDQAEALVNGAIERANKPDLADFDDAA